MKNKIKDYTIILVFAIIISIPSLNKNFNIYGDDGIQHIARLMGTYQSIAEGEIPPVIMSNFCNGFGYSWNIFYSPITDFSTQYAKIPAMYPMKAIQVMFFMYQPKVIFSSPMTTTPAAEPMMSIEPPTPAQ